MDYKQYHHNWRDIIRPGILKRDQYKCRHCGIRHKTRVFRKSKGEYQICDFFIEQWAVEQGKRVFTVFLQVAHIDQDKSNNNPDNLMTLCPVCHGKFDKQHKQLARTFFKKQIQDNPTEQLKIYSLEDKSLIGEVIIQIRNLTGVRLTEKQSKSIINLINKNRNYVD